MFPSRANKTAIAECKHHQSVLLPYDSLFIEFYNARCRVKPGMTVQHKQRSPDLRVWAHYI